MRSNPRYLDRVPVRLGLFAAALALVFGVAAAVGAAVHPGQPAAVCGSMHGMSHETLGLSVTQDGTTIAPASFAASPGARQLLRFRVLGSDGAPLRSGYQIEAQRRLHLIVVRRDLTGYQHLHPRMSANGTWSVPLRVSEPGAYRVFADFQLRCDKHVLAGDLLVPGSFRPTALPAASPVASADGYDVQLASPVVRAGHEAQLRFTVSRHGRPVHALERYLGARGHLVALRQGDLAYLHVHPESHRDAANAIPFAAEFPSAGSYRLFLQFQIADVVRTTAFTVEVAP
ncbi:MAG TPA: hypothetical protein VFD90_12895 [Gaiellales bacterium]|nr:hypothetical protein [Gaiellales bacterium]